MSDKDKTNKKKMREDRIKEKTHNYELAQMWKLQEKIKREEPNVSNEEAAARAKSAYDAVKRADNGELERLLAETEIDVDKFNRDDRAKKLKKSFLEVWTGKEDK